MDTKTASVSRMPAKRGSHLVCQQLAGFRPCQYPEDVDRHDCASWKTKWHKDAVNQLCDLIDQRSSVIGSVAV
jgi:hypothetical protein